MKKPNNATIWASVVIASGPINAEDAPKCINTPPSGSIDTRARTSRVRTTTGRYLGRLAHHSNNGGTAQTRTGHRNTGATNRRALTHLAALVGAAWLWHQAAAERCYLVLLPSTSVRLLRVRDAAIC